MGFHVQAGCFEPKIALDLYVSCYLLCAAALTLKFPGMFGQRISKRFQVIYLPGTNMGM